MVIRFCFGKAVPLTVHLIKASLSPSFPRPLPPAQFVHILDVLGPFNCPFSQFKSTLHSKWLTKKEEQASSPGGVDAYKASYRRFL